MCVCLCVCMYMYACMHVCMHACMYVCMCRQAPSRRFPSIAKKNSDCRCFKTVHPGTFAKCFCRLLALALLRCVAGWSPKLTRWQAHCKRPFGAASAKAPVKTQKKNNVHPRANVLRSLRRSARQAHSSTRAARA